MNALYRVRAQQALEAAPERPSRALEVSQFQPGFFSEALLRDVLPSSAIDELTSEGYRTAELLRLPVCPANAAEVKALEHAAGIFAFLGSQYGTDNVRAVVAPEALVAEQYGLLRGQLTETHAAFMIRLASEDSEQAA